MIGNTLIFCGGKTDLGFASDYLKNRSYDTVVCADSGLNAAYALHVPVSYFMGDFDSVSEDVLKQYKEKCVSGSQSAEWIQYPRRKDATDMHMVLDWVVEHEPSEITILGATGGRLDHFLANVNLLMLPLKKHIPAYIVDKQNKLYLINKNHTVCRENLYGKYISLQPLTQKVTGITLKGFEYPLHQFTMTYGDSRGVSNEMAQNEQKAFIELSDGVLIVTESKDDE